MKELLNALLPVAVELASDVAKARNAEEAREAQIKAEEAMSDRIKMWQMANGKTEPPL